MNATYQGCKNAMIHYSPRVNIDFEARKAGLKPVKLAIAQDQIKVSQTWTNKAIRCLYMTKKRLPSYTNQA